MNEHPPNTSGEPESEPRPGAPPVPSASGATAAVRARGEGQGAPQASGLGLWGSVVEWVTRRKALASLDERLEPERKACLLRAQAALELATRALEGVDPPRYGSALPFALSLGREAAYWALAARADVGLRPSLDEALVRAPSAVLEAAAGGAEAFALVKKSLVDQTFIDTALLPAAAQRDDAKRVLAFTRALVHDVDRHGRAFARLFSERLVRSFLVAALVLTTASGTLAATRARGGPNLAAGKPWRASSTYEGSLPPDTFFHTKQEDSPWVEIDLGAPTRVSRVEVLNLPEGGLQARAIPAVVETSVDGKVWREQCRRLEPFDEWACVFERQEARFVRVRALRRTWLHLRRVAVRR
jgi:F5/8 type C domain-containing protein